MNFSRIAQGLLRLVWFGIIPALLAALSLRFGLPAPHAAGPDVLLRLSEVAQRHPVEAFVLAFLVFTSLLRYWRFYLPFGYGLAELDPQVAVNARRADLAELERAARRAKVSQASWIPTVRFVAGLGIAAVAALLLRAELFQNYSVLSSSMLPTLERGDQITANRRAYPAGALPARADVVIFQHNAEEDVVKRVIGLPGDEIRMRGGFPIINGWEVPHCSAGRYVYWGGGVSADGQLFVEFLNGKAYLTLHVPPARPFATYLVKSGEVFVLGDNRNSSMDSRNWKNGEPRGLPLSAVVGQVGRILASPKRNAELDPASLFTRVDELHLNADALDTRDLERQVLACIKTMPENTRPPARDASAQLSQVVTTP